MSTATDWIEHDGKGMPVDPEACVFFQLRREQRWYVDKYHSDVGTPARELRWEHMPNCSDVIAYRVVSK